MAKALSTVQRTTRELRKQGRIYAIAEHFNPHVGQHGIRQDMFGFIDLVVLDPVDGIVAIQTCGRGQRLAHEKKILSTANALDWLECGGKIELWSWMKSPIRRGAAMKVWKVRVDHITEDHFRHGIKHRVGE